MESDGRIRSKDIGTGEVNSRALDDIRSSNYNGSHTDPENDPGTTGWQILKSGFVVINDAIIRGTLLAGRILSGTLNISEGGSITVGDELDPLATLDEDGLRVAEGQVQALWGFVDEETVVNQTLGSTAITSSATNVLQIVINPPDWVEVLYVKCAAEMFVGNSTGAPHRLDMRTIVDDGGASSAFQGTSQEKEANGISRSLGVSQALLVPLSPAGRTVTITQRGTLSTGSTSDADFSTNVMVLGVRNAFV
jgi:hypothetical protein